MCECVCVFSVHSLVLAIYNVAIWKSSFTSFHIKQIQHELISLKPIRIHVYQLTGLQGIRSPYSFRYFLIVFDWHISTLSREIAKSQFLLRVLISECQASYLVFRTRYAFAKLYNIYVKREQDTVSHRERFVHPSV